MNKIQPPTLEEISTQLNHLSHLLVPTPCIEWGTHRSRVIPEVPANTVFKLELLQHSGSFKMRGALSVLDALPIPLKERGIIAGTGGNHGIAVAAAVRAIDERDGIKIPTTVVVPETMNRFRRQTLESFGVRVLTTPTISEVLKKMQSLAISEELTVVHPFENPLITLGTATLGIEFHRQSGPFDAVIIPVGGGGLASGVSSCLKPISPTTKIYAVEPEGAQTLQHSLLQGFPTNLPTPPMSIADSLCAPLCELYSFSICRDFIDEVVSVSDTEIAEAMKILANHLKLSVEPAGATATAALLGPLQAKCKGKKVGIIVCGSNIDIASHQQIISTTV